MGSKLFCLQQTFFYHSSVHIPRALLSSQKVDKQMLKIYKNPQQTAKYFYIIERKLESISDPLRHQVESIVYESTRQSNIFVKHQNTELQGLLLLRAIWAVNKKLLMVSSFTFPLCYRIALLMLSMRS